MWSINCQNGTCGISCITVVPQSSWTKLFLLSSISSFPFEILFPLSNTWQMDSPLISYSKVCKTLQSCNILGQTANFHYSISNITQMLTQTLWFCPSMTTGEVLLIWKNIFVETHALKLKKKRKMWCSPVCCTAVFILMVCRLFVLCKLMYRLPRSKIPWLISTVHPDYF